MHEISTFIMKNVKKNIRGNVAEQRITVIEIRFITITIKLRIRVTFWYEELHPLEEIWLIKQLTRICKPAWK